MTEKLTKGQMIKWALNVILPIVIMLIPTNEIFTPQMRLFFASTLFGILCFAFETVNQTVVAIMLPLFWIFTKVAEPEVAFSPWLQYIPWMTLSGLFMANVLESTGLLARVSYFCILKTGASYKGILVGIAIAGFLLTMFVGQLVIPMAALTYGICKALNTGKSKASAGIMLVGAMSILVVTQAKFMSPMLMMGIGSSVTGQLPFVGFFESWYINAPTLLLYIILVVIATVIFKPDTPVEGKEFFERKLQEMGKLSVGEWKCAGIVLFYFLYIIFQKQHGLSLEWGMALIPMIMCLPGIGAATEKDIRQINYGFIIFVTACMGIGAVAGSLGLGKIIVEQAMPILQGQSHYVFFLLVWLVLVLLNFVMTPLAMEAAFTVPFVTIAIAMGINPMALYFFMLNGIDQIVMPYQYALYMIFFAFGLIPLKEFMKMMSIKMVLATFTVFAITLTWWKMIGFLFA